MRLIGEYGVRTAIICEKWELNILDGQGGFFAHTNISELSRRAICFEWLMQWLPKGISVTEYFGGIGLQSLIIQKIVAPVIHKVFDLDIECVYQLSMSLKGYPVSVAKYDARNAMPVNSTKVAILDFPNMTAKRYDEWQLPLSELLLIRKPEFVEITDVGNRFLHLHTGQYSEILGREIETISDYILGISDYVNKNYGYSVFKAAYKSGTSYMLFKPGIFEEVEFFHVGPNKNGFRYLDS